MTNAKIETDVCQDTHTMDSGDIGRIRREFLSGVVLALMTRNLESSTHGQLWDFAEASYKEGKRRGYLP